MASKFPDVFVVQPPAMSRRAIGGFSTESWVRGGTTVYPASSGELSRGAPVLPVSAWEARDISDSRDLRRGRCTSW